MRTKSRCLIKVNHFTNVSKRFARLYATALIKLLIMCRLVRLVDFVLTKKGISGLEKLISDDSCLKVLPQDTFASDRIIYQNHTISHTKDDKYWLEIL